MNRLLHVDPEMLISKAILKYGYSPGRLRRPGEIIEFCGEDNLIDREQYYLNLLSPEYNIVQVAGRPPKIEYTEEIKEKIRSAIKEK
jgi:hypothetical protein